MMYSYHAQFERANRLARLEETVGFTRVVLEVPVIEESKRYCITSSGILIIKALEEDFVITAFMCNINQCYRLYRLAGKSQISPKMEKRIMKNLERHPDLFNIHC